MRQRIPMVIGTNKDTEKGMESSVSTVSLVNCWMDRQENVCRFPGFVAEYDLGTKAAIDGLYESKVTNLRLAVSAGRLFTISTDGSFSEIAGVQITSGVPVSFTEDGDSILFAAKSQLHRYSGGVVSIIANSPQNITFVGYIRGFIITNGDGVDGDTHYSDDKINGYTTWEVFNNESLPDALMTMRVNFEQVLALGVDTTEISYLSGDPTNPFAVNAGATLPYGTTGQYSAAFDGESVYFMANIQGNRKVVRLLGGRQPQLISFPLDIPLADMTTTEDACGLIMTFRGQSFYIIHFPSANIVLNDQEWSELTLAYDIQRGYWIILGQWDTEAAEYRPYRVVSFLHIESWGKTLVGGRDGRIFSFHFPDADDYTQEPILLHRWRNDGNQNWQNPRLMSLGQVGEYPKFLRTNACGKYYSRQHEFVFSDASEAGEMFRMALVTGNIDYKTGRQKRNAAYIYNVKRGTLGFAIGYIEEELQVLPR